MTKKVSYIIYIYVLLSALFVACDDDAHENEYPLSEGQGALIVGLKGKAGVDALALYLFGSDGTTALCKTYDDPRALALEYIPVPAGSYTLAVVANGAGALPQETTVADLQEWLKAHVADFPTLQTAAGQVEIADGGIHRVLQELADGADGIRLSTVRLALALPGADLPAYTATRAGNEGKPLRCVAEVWQAGTENRVHRRTQLCTPQADGTYLAELSLMPGNYDLRLWADWDGGYYDADDLGAVTVLTDSYVANGETGKKDAYYTTAPLQLSPEGRGPQTQSLPSGEVGGAGADLVLALERPFAKYRLVATDVEAYLNLIKSGEDLPAIGDLQVRVTYEGFFPTGFNVATGKPNDALNTGICYTSVPTVAGGYDEAAARQVGADFVLTNGTESSVAVTIQMLDPRTGEAVATVPHVDIPCRRGRLTTVTGHFLTAGKTAGGVQVDTGWDDVVIEF